jgi:hypothetical protein
MQSRIQSFIESVANVAIGFLVALASQLIIFPVFDIHIPLSENLAIGAFFTVISIVRSYVVRRIFNRIHGIKST